MDETILEKALAGELEEEGAENVFMSEAGWASYLDKEGQSYAMNERVSKASDGYFTADMFSNPIDVFKSWVGSMQSLFSLGLISAFHVCIPRLHFACTSGNCESFSGRCTLLLIYRKRNVNSMISVHFHFNSFRGSCNRLPFAKRPQKIGVCTCVSKQVLSATHSRPDS